MKKKNKSINFVSLIILVAISIVFSFTCKENQKSDKSKEIIVLLGTDNVEINADIEHSIEGIKTFLNDNNIKLIIKSHTEQSGYILKYDSKEKQINTAMTDIDLLEICKEFYK